VTTCAFARVQTSFAELLVAASDKGVCFLTWCDGGEQQRLESHCATSDLVLEETGSELARQYLASAAKQLLAYGAGECEAFDLELDLRGTAFQRAAWTVLRGIPFGETITYGEQAVRMGKPGASRAVGSANGRNPVPILVPCHRVVASAGLGGYSGGLDRKVKLLAIEGQR
jgi:O-6-methylguanine DNA methyltransferase